MIKQIIVCDCCGKELKSNSERYHIDFDSLRFIDGAGDSDYNTIRVELCENCCRRAVQSLQKIADFMSKEEPSE